MKNRLEYDRLSFKKRISKLSNSKRRPNSSFIVPSTNYTINSLYTKGDKSASMKKSQEYTRYTQLNNSCYYDQNYYDKKKLELNSTKSQKKNKNILYEDSLKLKTKINKLKKELALMKSDNLKKTEEIKKRKRDIISAKAREKTFDNLKEENTISKLKGNYESLNNKIKIMKENNNKIINDFKCMDLYSQEKENSDNLLLLKDKILEYNSNLEKNLEFNNKLFLTYFNRDEFFSNHNYIENIQKQIEEKNKKIYFMNQNLYHLKERYYKIEQERKKIASYNTSLQKRNERLLIEKKKREDFILQKPIILGKINEYEKKIKGIEDMNKKDENEIVKLSNASKMILKQLKESQVSKPMNYDKLITIENNPNANIDQKIILLESLIKESKDRQNEFIEIFEYYDDYVQQKEKYDIINDEAKMIEEKNLININNNSNNIINDNENNNINNNVSEESNAEEKKNLEKESAKKEEDSNNDNIIFNNDNIEKIENIDNKNDNEEDNKSLEKEDKEVKEENNILNNSPSSIDSKNKEKFNEIEQHEEETKENREEINQIELSERELNDKKEKKYKSFKFLLSIIFMNQGLKKETIENLIQEENSDIKIDKYLSNISKNILNLIEDKNEKDIKILTKIFKNQLQNNYSNDLNIFKEKIIPDFLEKNKFTLIQSEEDENLYLSKIIRLFGPSSNKLLEKLSILQADDKKLISLENLKKMLKEENIYNKDDKEKKNIFKFFIFVLKKNSSFNDENNSINDFYIEDVQNFLKGIYDIINGKKLESEDLNEEDDGLTITDEDFKKIMNGFLRDLSQKIEEKNLELQDILGEENIREIEKNGKIIKIMDIYKFVEKLKENDINLGDSLVISCIFNRYQLNENSEDINIIALEQDLEKKQIILL